MTNHMILTQETGKRITATDECELVRAAWRRSPDSPLLRTRLAMLLNINDAFGETLSLYDGVEPASLAYQEAILLAQALNAQENDADTRRTVTVARAAFARAEDDRHRAGALALEGKALVRLGEPSAAERCFKRALDLDPHSKDACKRLAALLLSQNDPRGVLDAMERLQARGAGHARLFAALALALARLGDVDAARAMVRGAGLMRRTTLAPPPGWPSIEAFNTALAAELLNHPGLRFDRYGTASQQTWRVDAPATGEAPLVRALLAQIEVEVDAHVRAVAGLAHPWAKARPERGTLHCWCVITEGDGFETWHVHQFGWLSGVYYVQIPDPIAQGEGPGGCIAFGLPDDIAGADAATAFGEELVRPSAGVLMTFPSHAYHRTFPHGSSARRICLAFDIWPD